MLVYDGHVDGSSAIGLQELASWCTIATGLFLAGRLIYLKLGQFYRLVCLYLLADISGSLFYVGAIHIPALTAAIDYRTAWLVNRTSVDILIVITITALLGAVLESYPGILRLGKTIVRVAWCSGLVIGVAVSAAELTRFNVWQDRRYNQLIHVGVIVERGLDISVVLVLLITLGFLLWFPIRLPRNLLSFAFGLIGYSGAKTTFFTVQDSLDVPAIRTISLVVDALSVACFLFWSVSLTRAGNRVQTNISMPWIAAHQDRLLQQLDGLNRSLLSAQSTRGNLPDDLRA